MRGMLIGMQLDKTVGDLALRYYATGEAIALQTRQIIDEMNTRGHKIESIFMSGGCVVASLSNPHERVELTRVRAQARQEPLPHEVSRPCHSSAAPHARRGRPDA